MPSGLNKLNSSINQPLFTIGITSNLIGVCQATLRIWEKKGLIQAYRIGKNRFYSQCNIDRLKEIKRLLQEERINIAGVKSILKKLFCWEVKRCSLKERKICPVYKQNTEAKNKS
ncbi:MAG: MerR family transcriptional regulator [Candidatus Omnitrophota bacterium]|nr:MerR family transcriptional regulator [Candidatus Omnitrophota bacterium]